MSVVRLTLFFLALASTTLPLAAQQASVALSATSDEFNDPATLGRWQWHHRVEGWPDLTKKGAIDAARDGGVLVLEPATSGWYEDWHAPFLFKEVTGDFDVTVRMQVTGLSTPLPTRTWSLAGLMARAPRTVTPATWTPGGENWVFITTGIAARPDQSVIETKTTVNSASRLQLSPVCAGWIELRTVRKGSAFSLSSRCPGGAWEERAAFDRPDLPATLQVGVAAYTDWDTMQEQFGAGGAAQFNTQGIPNGHPDLRVLVDYVRFAGPGR
jgi:hypothetical protein